VSVAAAGLLALSIGAACTDDDPAATGDSIPVPTAADWTVSDVVDGDTIVVERSGNEERVRIVGVNTPESGECLADRATDRLAELIEDRPVRLVRDTSDTDEFDRLLRYVETVDGVDVGAVLVAEGLAVARRFEPDVARALEYERLQADARTDAAGLWAPDACGPATVAAGTVEITVNADPPGDDTDDLTGEWVEFTNTGGERLDLDGFVVADESASNRYEFDAVTLAPGRTVRLVTGCGTDTDALVHWCSGGSAIWNNGGDTVFLRDRSGNLVVALTYDGS
jgi:micrococcal nuclease